MQMFIPSVLSALEALLKCPAWLLRKVFSIFSSQSESPPPQISSDLCSQSDSPYEGTPSQWKPYDGQASPRRPVVEYHQTPSQHSAYPPSQYSPYQPRRQPSAQYPTRPTPLVPRDVPSVVEPYIPQRPRRDVPSLVEPVSYIPQRPRHDIPSVSAPVSYIPQRPHRDVFSVAEPVSYIPQRPHRDVSSVAEPASYIPQVCPGILHLLFTHFFNT
ncbi:hypothetical protein DFH29DRAFT_545199 [Suillus ampliporus]|nr:hypothetical protein DFH29DRAFT_545199 [Suillus ampliporus]